MSIFDAKKVKLGYQKKFLSGVIIMLFLAFLTFPFFTGSYVLHILILCFIWSVVACNWNLIMGYAGIFSLGQITFFVGGAYTSAIIAKSLGISPWIGILIAGILMGLLGFVIGLPCLRIKGVYIGLFTLVFHECLAPLLIWGKAFGTGGATGLISIPPLRIGGFVFNEVSYYYTAFAVFLAVLYIVYRIINSSVGRAFVAIRDSEVFAENLGVNEYKYRLMVFGISAFFTGIIGGFYAHYLQVISPKLLSLSLFLTVLLMVEGGGLGRFGGGVLGAFVVTILGEFLRPVGEFRLLIFGALMVIIIVLIPQGMIGVGDVLKDVFKKKLFRKRELNSI